MSVNKVILIGYLGRDPEFKVSQNGKSVCRMNLATNDVYKGKDGSKVTKTDWHQIVCFNNLAEIASRYLKKGAQVYFEGKLKTRTWEGDAGVKMYATEVVVDEMTMLGTTPKRERDETPNEEPPINEADDLPF